MKTSIFSILSLLFITVAPGAAYGDDELEFTAKLRGSNEVPPVETRTKGRAEFEANESRTKLKFEWVVRRANTILGTAGAHIHCGGPTDNGPVAAFIGGVIEGGLKGTVKMKGTLTDQNVRDVGCGTNIATLVDAMIAGQTYVNIHSLENPRGEVRGQIRLEAGDDGDPDD